jgi:hypothetical protein
MNFGGHMQQDFFPSELTSAQAAYPAAHRAEPVTLDDLDDGEYEFDPRVEYGPDSAYGERPEPDWQDQVARDVCVPRWGSI